MAAVAVFTELTVALSSAPDCWTTLLSAILERLGPGDSNVTRSHAQRDWTPAARIRAEFIILAVSSRSAGAAADMEPRQWFAVPGPVSWFGNVSPSPSASCGPLVISAYPRGLRPVSTC